MVKDVWLWGRTIWNDIVYVVEEFLVENRLDVLVKSGDSSDTSSLIVIKI